MNCESRPYQDRIVGSAIEYMEDGGRSCLIESPTGSGKSIMGLRVADHFANQGFRIAWVAMRRNLLKQIEAEAKLFGFRHEIIPVSMFDKNPPQADFMVVDEAHHDATDSMARIHSRMRPTKVLGLSATPQRQDRVGLCFEKSIRDAGIAELVSQGYLSQYHHYTINHFTPEEVASTFVKWQHIWGKSLVFWHTYEQCTKFQQCLRDLGFHSSDIVTGNTDRDTQLDKFEAGETQLLINMMVLTEGFNSPSLRTVFLRPSFKNPTIQMGGRVFRQFPGITHKNVVQCEYTHYPFPRHVKPSEQFKLFEGEWRRVALSKNIDAIAFRTRRFMIAAAENSVRAICARENGGEVVEQPMPRRPRRRFQIHDND